MILSIRIRLRKLILMYGKLYFFNRMWYNKSNSCVEWIYMGLYDRWNEWPEISINVLVRTIPDYRTIVIRGQSSNFKYSSKYFFTEKELLVLSYNSIKNVFVAWNSQIHNHIHNPNACPIVRTANYSNIEISDDEIRTVYMHRRNYGYVKIAFIGMAALHRFCSNFDFFLAPNPSDDNFQSPAMCVTNTGELGFINDIQSDSEIDKTIRQREYISRFKRDSTFRNRILKEYNYQCVVCGCTERKILQAAHIYDVKYGNDDSTDNGVCLCANHHILYDSGLLNINWENGTFSCISESEQKMPWYLEAQKRDFKLHR